MPYAMTGYNRFLDKNRYPGIKPPWGSLNAVDLNSGKLLWKVPLGEFEELNKQGISINRYRKLWWAISNKRRTGYYCIYER